MGPSVRRNWIRSAQTTPFLILWPTVLLFPARLHQTVWQVNQCLARLWHASMQLLISSTSQDLSWCRPCEEAVAAWRLRKKRNVLFRPFPNMAQAHGPILVASRKIIRQTRQKTGGRDQFVRPAGCAEHDCGDAFRCVSYLHGTETWMSQNRLM